MLLVVSGIPGSGKTHFAKQLESKGWYRIDHDRISRSGELERSWLSIFQVFPVSPSRVRAFAVRAIAQPASVVVEFGFPVQWLGVIASLRDNGAKIWWFDGDRDACLSSWRRAWRGAQPDSMWRKQVADIDRKWASISRAYGANVVTTCRVDGHVPIEDIQRIMEI